MKGFVTYLGRCKSTVFKKRENNLNIIFVLKKKYIEIDYL